MLSRQVCNDSQLDKNSLDQFYWWNQTAPVITITSNGEAVKIGASAQAAHGAKSLSFCPPGEPTL